MAPAGLHAFVTIEPCVMCSGRLGLPVFQTWFTGLKNQKFGAAGSLYDILTDERLNHRVEVEAGILEDDCAAIMQDFSEIDGKNNFSLKTEGNVV